MKLVPTLQVFENNFQSLDVTAERLLAVTEFR